MHTLGAAMAAVPIMEIIGRSTQGVTRPFICRGADQALYFVKGRGAGKRSLICEWIAGTIANRMGLPVAPFAVVDIPQALIALGSRNDLSELGAGLAFGSRKLDLVELLLSHLPQIPSATQQNILMFDWWVENADRSLREAGGNPNLFWDGATEKLVVIDHNQAFDPAFSVADFCAAHAFRAQIGVLSRDQSCQRHYTQMFEKILADWHAICSAVPHDWWFIDAEQTLPVDFNRDTIQERLMRYRSAAFWTMS
jgi:hypothetical protein